MCYARLGLISEVCAGGRMGQYGFRIGGAGGNVSPTVYFGKAVLMLFQHPIAGVHRTCSLHDLPAPPRVPWCHWYRLPAVEWVEGDPGEFSQPPIDCVEMVDGKVMMGHREICKYLCAQCHKEGHLRCSRCRRLVYCCKDCQVAHWPLHKRVCRR